MQRSRLVGLLVGAVLGGGAGWLSLQALVWRVTGQEEPILAAIVCGVLLGAPLGAALAPLAQTQRSDRLISPYGLTVSVLAWLLWLGPITYVGFAKDDIDGFPPFMRNLQRISCLFTSSTPSWKTEHYEVRFLGKQGWVEGPMEGFFEQGAYGYRTRFNRLLRQSVYLGQRGEQRRDELALFIARRWMLVHPDDPRIAEVRFVRATHPVGGSVCLAPGAWQRPPLVEIAEEHKEVVDAVTVPVTGEL